MNKKFLARYRNFLFQKKIANILAIIAFSMIYALAIGQSAGSLKLDDILNGLQQRYEKTATYKTDFEQTLISEAFKKVIRTASGVIYYAKPGKIRWEYQKPEKHIYLIDGEVFWDYDVEQKQVIKIPLKDALAGNVPQGFLFGAGNFKKDFEVKLLGYSNQAPTKGYALSLTPRDKELRNVISNLEMLIDERDFRVVSAKFLDAQGNINQYVFSNSELNPKLKPELFIFSIPTGVRVILPVTPGESHTPR